jgi:hypothetical protein
MRSVCVDPSSSVAFWVTTGRGSWCGWAFEKSCSSIDFDETKVAVTLVSVVFRVSCDIAQMAHLDDSPDSLCSKHRPDSLFGSYV